MPLWRQFTRVDGRTLRGWVLGTAVFVLVIGSIYSYYRSTYNHAKRFRIVSEGKFYRCGQLTGNGFREAFQRYGIKTVINLQEEDRNPMISNSWRGAEKVSESDVCRSCGVKYVALDGGVLDNPEFDSNARPAVIDDFLDILDHPDIYPPPVLIHCKAGLHRTGLLTAIYRMEYESKTQAEVVRELRANGFGTFAATDGNEYLVRYVLNFNRGVRRHREVVAPPRRCDERRADNADLHDRSTP